MWREREIEGRERKVGEGSGREGGTDGIDELTMRVNDLFAFVRRCSIVNTCGNT